MTKLLEDIQGEPAQLRRCLEALAGSSRRAVERAATILRAAPYVHVVGIGSSWNAGIAVSYALQRAGIAATALDASELLHFGPPPHPAAVLVLSRSGRSIEIVRLIERLQPSDSRIVAVTNTAETPLTAAADAVVSLDAPFDHLVSIVMYSGLLLAGCVIALEAQRALSEGLTGQLSTALEQADAAMPLWQAQIESSSWLSGNDPTYFLARGPSLATAHEARLLWEEAAKMPASALSTGGFRHGSQEAIRPGMRVALWIDAARQRKADLQLAADLRATGARVLVIGHDLHDTAGDLVLDVPATPDGLQPLVDIIPAQLAAERLALLRSQDCDSFRYCPYVIEHEGGLAAGPALK